MRNRRLAGALASVVITAQILSGQSAATRSEDLSRAMARVGVERVFSAFALDHGRQLYGAWVAGYDLYLEQFGAHGAYEIISLDLRTGERKWVVRTGPYKLKAAPYPGDRYVVFLTECDGGMIVVNRATGAHEFRLRAELNVPTTFAAVSSDTSVYVSNLASSQIVAVSPSDARVGWRFPTGSILTTGPVITPRVPRRLIAVGALDGTVTAVHAQGWDEAQPKTAAWKHRVFGPVNAMTVAEGLDQGRRFVVILVSCEDGGLYALDTASGEPRWVYRTENPIKVAAVASGGFVFARAGNLIAVDLATGLPKWKGSNEGTPVADWEKATSGMAADANRAYLRTDVNDVWRVDSKTGKIIASTSLSEFDTILAAPEANMILGLTNDGYVTAYR